VSDPGPFDSSWAGDGPEPLGPYDGSMPHVLNGARGRSPAPDPEGLREFLQAYEVYVREVLQPTQREVRAILERWQQPEHWAKYKRTNRIPIPTPVRMAFSRIKRPEQVVDKIFRKPESFPDGVVPASFRRMHDTIGVRVLVYVLSHLPLIDRELRGSDVVEVSAEEPATAYMSASQVRLLGLDHLVQQEKESGYSSIHYTLRLRSSVVPEGDRPWFELQVQTVTQELWSVMEHHLGYKPGSRTNVAARRQFTILAKMLNAIDEHFTLLYEELNRFQEEASYEAEDSLEAENLPSVLAEFGIACAQRDINNILKFLYSRGVGTVNDLRDLATPRRLAIVRNTYLSVVGRPPVSLEVIATLAAMRGAPNEAEEIQRVKAQIEYRGAWDAIRQEFTQT
jgi:putative GTP pyrophosphokinase